MRSILFALLLLAALIVCPGQQTKPEETIYKAGEEVRPPRPISTPMPNFSADASRGKFNGSIVVSGYVGTDGKVHGAKISKSIGDAKLDAKALDAVKSWKFHPCTKDDKPVNCAMNFEMAVHLD